MFEKKKIFLCTSQEDLQHIRGLKAIFYNPNFEIDFYDEVDQEPFDSSDADYAKRVIRAKIRRSDIVLCIIGEETHKSDWVRWQIDTSIGANKIIIYMARKGVFRANLEQITKDENITFYPWDLAKLEHLIRNI